MNVAEHSAVQWGTTRIPYAIRRSARRGTVSIAVDPEIGVLLTAPEGTTVARLDGLVRQKAQWIVDRLRETRALPPRLPGREFVSGETFLYLGRQYRLRLFKGEPRPLAMRGGWLELGVPGGLGEAYRAAYARAALIDWYTRRARDVLPPRVEAWAARIGVDVARVVVCEQEKRWGSCDKRGVVRLNWRIVQAPSKVVDYVVAHEVAHRVCADHGKEFWGVLGRVMPGYEERRGRLRSVGSALLW